MRFPVVCILLAGAMFLAGCGPSPKAEISGELRQWHKVTLTLDGPSAQESDTDPNPFVDYRMTVTFAHDSGEPSYQVPGYFAADGNAGETSAEAGNKWRAHVSPDKAGVWTYDVEFMQGEEAAVNRGVRGTPVPGVHGASGSFEVLASDKTGRDFRGRGRLEYVGKHHLQFAGSGEYFLKAGPDAPETFLAYEDFDGTSTNKVELKTWAPHMGDWREGDPTWKGGKGKGMIGALNYLAAEGLNAFSFLPYNAGGDGDNVWPFIARDDKLHYDVSKLDQWQIVFDHAQAQGLYLHFKLQENEIDDTRVGHGRKPGEAPTALDGGKLGVERKLYCRELIARFGYELALNWNLGEENTQSPEEQRDMAAYIREVDPYDHHIVVHTFPGDQDKVYSPLLGEQSVLTGASLQNPWDRVHQRTLQWVKASAEAGKPWVVANDEQNPATQGAPPDPGYEGYDGTDRSGKPVEQSIHDIRKYTLWGNIMAGGAGVEYYFGYQLPQNDLIAEDYRSRDKSWDYCRIALDFFRKRDIPFWEMTNANALIGNPENNNSKYALARPGDLYLVYLPNGGSTTLDLSEASGSFTVSWFNPRDGGEPGSGTVRSVEGGGKRSLGNPPADAGEDWLVILRPQG